MIFNILETSMHEWKNHETKLMIWGNSNTACMIARFLERNNVIFDGFVINSTYYNNCEHKLIEYEVYCLEDYLNYNKCSLIVGFTGYKDEMLGTLNKSNIVKIYLYDFLGMLAIGEDNTIDESYIKNNKDVLNDLRNMLYDEKSKKSLDIFLNQKLTGTYQKVYEKNIQYFDKEIINFGRNEIFIDCGAFHGETVVEFIKSLYEQGIDTWKDIIALEADPDNANMMREQLSVYTNIHIEQAAAWDTKGYQSWSDALGQSSRVTDEGTRQVRTITLDEIGRDKDITFIKMDIEGAELRALRGAESLIRTTHPKLAICVYHRPEDLLTIPQYIKELYPMYKLYLRNYSPWGVETVLYAVE